MGSLSYRDRNLLKADPRFVAVSGPESFDCRACQFSCAMNAPKAHHIALKQTRRLAACLALYRSKRFEAHAPTRVTGILSFHNRRLCYCGGCGFSSRFRCSSWRFFSSGVSGLGCGRCCCCSAGPVFAGGGVGCCVRSLGGGVCGCGCSGRFAPVGIRLR